jgi:hypothetical protein|uniref:Antitoxin SocA-like Panacea domain-containing protein n=1 Tax=Thermodesulfobium narugense TaxID=184064 RepID=A0A7C5KC94_9BACT
MNNLNLLKGSALVYTLVKTLTKKRPDVQIGKTVVQKMMYLLEKELGYDFDFSMYHYGPFSAEVSGYLNFAESVGIIDMTWDPQRGYFIKPKSKKKIKEIIEAFEESLDKKDKKTINKIVDKYGKLNPIAIKLSIIATALYAKDNFNVKKSELINVVKSLKPEYSDNYIKETLKEATLFNEPH